jgi:hypothetical protein
MVVLLIDMYWLEVAMPNRFIGIFNAVLEENTYPDPVSRSIPLPD